MVFHSYVYKSALLELFESTMKVHCAVCAPIPAHFRILKRQLDIVYVRSLHFYSFCHQIKSDWKLLHCLNMHVHGAKNIIVYLVIKKIKQVKFRNSLRFIKKNIIERERERDYMINDNRAYHEWNILYLTVLVFPFLLSKKWIPPDF